MRKGTAFPFASSDNSTNDAISQLRIIAGLCNSSEFDAATLNLPLPERKMTGDATDQALLRFSESLGSVIQLRQFWKTTFELPFNSKNKFMIKTLSLSDTKGLTLALPPAEANIFKPDKEMLLTIKGAPDILMDGCTHFTGNSGETCVLDDNVRRQITEIKDQWSAQGMRVILLGRKVVLKRVNDFASAASSAQHEEGIIKSVRAGLTFVGLVAIKDPPRDEIPEVVKVLRRAGIRIFMVCPHSSLQKQTSNGKEC